MKETVNAPTVTQDKPTIAQIEALYGERLKKLGLKAEAVNQRLTRQLNATGTMNIEEALSPPRKQLLYEAFGEKRSLAAWAAEYNLSETTLRQRLTQRHMRLENALTEPLSATRRKHGKQWKLGDESKTMRQWAAERNIRYPTLRAYVTRQMEKGKSEEEALGYALSELEENKKSLILKGERKPIEEWAKLAKLDVATLQDRVDRGHPLASILEETKMMTAYGVSATLREWATAMLIKPQELLAVYRANKNKAHQTVLRIAAAARASNDTVVSYLETAVTRLRKEQEEQDESVGD